MSTPFEFEDAAWGRESAAGADFGEFALGETDLESEYERGRWRPPRASRPARPTAFRPVKKRPVWPRPRPRPGRWPRYPIIEPARGVGPSPAEPPADQMPAGTEHARWVQSALNRVLGLRLPVTGVMDAATRSAVRSFQRQRGLPVDGIVGPPTEAALAAAYAEQAAPSTSAPETEVMFGSRPCGCSGLGKRGGPCPRGCNRCAP